MVSPNAESVLSFARNSARASVDLSPALKVFLKLGSARFSDMLRGDTGTSLINIW